MTYEGIEQEIMQRGWTDVDFGLPEKVRARYAQLANAVISIALEDEHVKESLSFELNPRHENGTVRTGTFGIGYPRNSVDTKVYLHTGYQSKQYAESIIPFRQQPATMQEFWQYNDGMLFDIERSAKITLSALGAEALRPHIFHSDDERRNVHLRTVRYTGALREPVSKEVISGHADLGLATLHLYETHGGWFHGVQYPEELIRGVNSSERRKAIREMRSNMQPLEQTDGTVPFFLGANWQNYPFTPDDLRDLPACYHAGIRPDVTRETISEYANEITGGEEDRVSVISFMHPHGDMLLKHAYTPATVSNCRPEYEEQ